MPGLHVYDIRLKAVIEIGGAYEADTAAQAIEQAKLELRAHGEIVDVQVERQLLDDPGVDNV